MERIIKTLQLFILLLLASWTAIPIVASAHANRPAAPAGRENEQGDSPLRGIWHFISRADGDRCPMYPTCSQYSAQAFAKKGPLLGLVLSCDRLLRCGRDETRLSPPINVNGIRHTLDPLTANTFWWDKK